MKENRSLLVLCTVTAIDLLGYGIIVPILPFYAEALGASASDLAVLVAAFPLAQSISYALLGRLSDRFGRRRLIVFGLAISAVSYVAFGFATSFSTLLLSRIGAGFGAGTFATQLNSCNIVIRTRAELAQPDIQLMSNPVRMDAKIWCPGIGERQEHRVIVQQRIAGKIHLRYQAGQE